MRESQSSTNQDSISLMRAHYEEVGITESSLLQAVGLNPVVVLLAILVGGTLMGVIGALLAIPFLSALIIILVSVEDE